MKTEITPALKDALVELIDALEAGNFSKAARLAGVKSYIGGMHDVFGEKGTKLYSYLDGLAFDLSMKTHQIPPGMAKFTADGVQIASVEGDSPTLALMRKERDEIENKICPNCKTNPPLQIISEGPTRIGFGQTPAYEYIIANKNIPEIIVELKNLAYKKGWADPLVGSRGVNTSVIFKTKINPGTIPHIEKEALEIAEGNVYPRYFLVAWDVKKESFINEDEARTRKAELKKEGWSVRSRTVYFDDGYRIFLTAVKEKGSEQMLCPNCKNIVLEPIKTNPPGALRCPSCKKAWMPNPRHLSKGPSVPAPEKVLFLHPSFGGGYWIQNPPETPNPAGDECSWRGCGRPAIGYEASVARGLNVCEVHASKTLKEMKPGETKGTPSKGNYYVRYPEVR
jgi:hypothetical protein